MKTIQVPKDSEVEAKQLEVSAKVAEYQAAQAHQLEHGGPGPVADYEIMEIANEHAGQFEVVSTEVPQEEVPEELPIE
jgi:hypothetical protein